MAEPIINQQALDYFEKKKLTPSFNYQDVWREEHNSAFTVAKMTQLDLLSDTKNALEDALESGQTFKQFQNTLKPMLIKRGWWGAQTMNDPLDGIDKEVQLGSDARLKTIYETNMRTARAAGQWDRIQVSKETHPYLLYSLGPSREHRAEHVKWDGLCLPVDDPFWLTHFAPNGWGCKCRIRQVSGLEYERLKKDGISTRVPELDNNGNMTGRWQLDTKPMNTTAPKVDTRQVVNRRTGEVQNVPKGIDPGWDYNPGVKSGSSLRQYNSKLNAAESQSAKASISQSIQSSGAKLSAFERWYQKPIGDFPVAILNSIDQARIGATVQTVVLSDVTATKQLRRHPEVKALEYKAVQDAIDLGEVVKDGAKSLIYILESQGYVSVVKATQSGKAVFVSSFRRLSQNEAKRDSEIQRLRAKADK